MATADNYTINIQVKGDQDLKLATTHIETLANRFSNMASSSGVINQFNNRIKETGESMASASERMALLREGGEKLVTVLAGVGAIELAHKLLESADATDKTANAFNMTIERTLELQAAFQKIGVEGNGMARTMTTVADAMVKLQQGDLDTIATFKQLGLTYDDLKGKSPDQQLVMITKAAADSKKTVEDLTAAHTLLGKKMTGKDLKEFNDTLQQVTGTMGGAAETTKHLKEVQDSLELSAIRIRTAFLELITPVAEFFSEFTKEGDHSKEIAIALAAAISAIAGSAIITGFGMVVGAIRSVAGAFGLMATGEAAATAATAALTEAEVAYVAVQNAGNLARAQSLTQTIALAEARIAELATAEASVLVEAQLVAAKRALMIASGQLATANGLAASSTAALAVAEEGATVATTGLTVAMGALMRVAAPLLIIGTVAAAAYSLYELYANKATESTDKNTEALKKQKAEANQTAETMKRLGMTPDDSAGAGRGGQAKPQLDQLAKVRQEQTNQLNVLKQQNEVEIQRVANQLKMINLSQTEKAYQEAKFTSIQKSNQEIFNLQNQIAVKEKEINNTKEGAAKATAQTELTGLKQRLTYVQQNKDQEAEVAAVLARQLEIEKQGLEIKKFGRDLEYKRIDEIYSLEKERSQLTMTDDQKRLASVKELINAEATAEIRRREAMLAVGESLNFEQQIEIINQVTKAFDPLIAKTKELISESRDFNTGWTKAYNDWMDNATNSAKVGADAFNSMTSNMNSAIDKFVDTGKLSFSDLASSIIKDLLKIELKAEATKIFGGMGGGGGLFGAIGGLLGFADGGDPPVGKASLVGERGPELFIPRTNGTIVPLEGKAAGGNMVNNTYITNHISAIDSKSVAQLFAENRKTLLGTVQLAQKELPYGNR
jgi:lambda family phage tail tape measure protein